MIEASWHEVMRVLIVGVLGYAGLVVMLRVSGNRTLSKMNSFDLVVTVAFGSCLATILLNKNVSLVEGLVAIGLLIALQFVITWTSVRSHTIGSMIKTAPTLLLRDGQFLQAAMKHARVTGEEIEAAIRQQGMGAVEEVAAVILEADGSLSVIAGSKHGSGSALGGVRNRGQDATRSSK